MRSSDQFSVSGKLTSCRYILNDRSRFPRTFKDEDEAIRLANDTEYGLNCNIFTRDIGRALRVAAQIESGTVSINAACMPSFQTPFGGYKQSGYGRECGIEVSTRVEQSYSNLS